LQNIPIRTEKGRLIRQAFTAPEGRVLLSVDYSQIDLRVLAHESGDENLINAFRNNADIHTQTAAEVFGVMPELVSKEQRTRAKTINFGIVYGQGPVALAQMLNISAREAKEYIDAYFARYSVIKKWLDAAAAHARGEGYVKTLFGHIRYMPEFEASNARLASFANRASVNTIVQGGSSDIIKKAMIDIYKEMPQDVLMLLQVHDELVFEVPQGKIKETAAWVKNKMESAVMLKVPLVAEAKAGKNWNEMGRVI
jgi:DNA polymerase-1